MSETQAASRRQRFKEVYYKNGTVSIYDFNPKVISSSADSWVFTGEAIVQFTYNKRNVFWTEYDTVEEPDVIELKVLPDEEAKELILQYITEHPGARTSDIVYNLAIDMDLVYKILNELKDSKLIEARDVE